MKRSFRTFAIFALVFALLGACANNTEVEVKPPLRIGWTTWAGWYPLALADAKGFFAENNLEVEIITYQTQSQVVAAVASGMVDGGFVVLNDTLLDSVAKNVKTVMISDTSNGGDQIISDSAIQDFADLRGKRIGVRRGSFSEFFVREMLTQKGILASEVSFVNVEPEQVPESIPSRIDMGHTYEPNTSRGIAKGQHIIFSSAETPGLIVSVFAVRRNILAERPEDVQAFVNAWFQTLEYWQTNPAESNALIAEKTGQKPDEISTDGIQIFNLEANRQAFRPGNTSASVYFTARKVLKFLTDSGFVTSPVDINDVLDASFISQ